MQVTVDEVKAMFDALVYERGPETGIQFLIDLNELTGKTRDDYVAIFNALRAKSTEVICGLLH